MDEKRMTVIEHLVELRKSLTAVVAAVTLGSLLCFSQIRVILPLLVRPVINANMVFYSPTEMFATSVRISVMCGALVASPAVFGSLAWFVSPGLTDAERRVIRWLVGFGSVLFGLGVAFAYFFLLPSAVRFMTRALETTGIQYFPSVERCVQLNILLLTASGLLFEMPMILVLLIKSRLVTTGALRKGRIYLLATTFVVSELLAPGLDFVSQALLAVPLYLLYEASILIGLYIERPERRSP